MTISDALAIETINERDKLLEENAKLKRHAEAMANIVDAWNVVSERAMLNTLTDLEKAADSYRADFPTKESKP